MAKRTSNPLRLAAALLVAALLAAACAPEPPPDPPRVHELSEPVDPYDPVIDLGPLGLRPEQVRRATVEQDGKTESVLAKPADDGLRLVGGLSYLGVNVLTPERPGTLRLETDDEQTYTVTFRAGGLPAIPDTGQHQVVYVPAMPEQGFRWPYFLMIPPDEYRPQNEGHRRYLLVETPNTTTRPTWKEQLEILRRGVAEYRLFSAYLAGRLWTPLLMPVFPRPKVVSSEGEKVTWFYTHGLDRDTAILHQLLEDPTIAPALRERFAAAGYQAEDFVHLDRQLVAMIDHAIAYLNRYGHGVEPEQVFLYGNSSPGTFTDRFAALHPDRVKAVASGATLDDMILPLAEYGGEELIFPIGVADYEAITGRPFDLAAHNRMARLIFMGEQDENNTLPFPDCYGPEEQRIITELWGEAILPRAQALIQLYGQAGGKGIFILDAGGGHVQSREMMDYVLAFLAANRDSDEPVYPIPEDPEQLKYTLYE